ncbi:efflux RND transporter periplasmic adaptor subunit [Pseudomonas gingeri]|uniref:Efflux RND transporter periplasmic adaptor subunit n=1 Tax=Pseudomonas gingeri TaxID=117681 RepID=A0A7Y7XCZ0_9PSED|nr:efflux RND transporter periplasmic adaptor subunit [Pseudomonas gingeri]NWA24947.1 efflux RND transporter periplasmic adaptor subunit [Pseudomonas gingeri]NWB96462.1 efflux RND transporter periplasmic adaptor subunit [Pseudomonas gingeri]NWD77682.1 efflux RND transporter periplasmic adaptor subunit [Pseudomonas gingeri]
MFTHARLRLTLTPIAFCALLSACGEHTAPDPRIDRPPLVSTATVKANPQLRERRFTGVIAARVESSMGFRVSGKISQRMVDVGQQVKRGDPLMKLDITDFGLDVKDQEAAVAAAQAAVVKADADFGRLQGLVSIGAVSAKAFDEAQQSKNAAHAGLEAAKAKLDLSHNAYGYAILRADVDGVVVDRFADTGQVVSAGQPVVVVAQDGPREARIALPETVRPALGSQVTARLYGNESQKFAARLRELSGSADPVTRTFAARYVLDGNSRAIPLGSTVVISLEKPGISDERELPLGAIYDRGQGPGVWVVGDDKKVHYKAVNVIRVNEETAVVGSGLTDGQTLVALGAHQLHEGEEVRVAEGQGHEKL